MMSGHVAEMAATAALFPNVVATIAKPFLSASLIDLVDAILANPPEIVAASAHETKPPFVQSGKKTRKSPPARKTTKAGAKKKIPSPSAGPPPAPPPSKPAATSTQSVNVPASTPPPKAHHNGAQSISEPANPPAAPESSAASEPQSASSVSVEAVSKVTSVPGDSPSSETQGSTNAPPPPPTSEAVLPHRGTAASTLETAQDTAILGRATPARIRASQSSTVVLTLPLEIASIQFSPSFQVRAIRARAHSSIVSIHMLPEAGSRVRAAAMVFKLDHVELDARGQIRTARLTPSAQPIVAPDAGSSVIVGDVDAFPDDGTIEVTSSPKKPTRIQLFALFDIVAVELTATFGVEHLVLRTRGAKVRLHLGPGEPGTGITFQSAQVLLDHSGLIAEVLLDTPE